MRLLLLVLVWSLPLLELVCVCVRVCVFLCFHCGHCCCLCHNGFWSCLCQQSCCCCSSSIVVVGGVVPAVGIIAFTFIFGIIAVIGVVGVRALVVDVGVGALVAIIVFFMLVAVVGVGRFISDGFDKFVTVVGVSLVILVAILLM